MIITRISYDQVKSDELLVSDLPVLHTRIIRDVSKERIIHIRDIVKKYNKSQKQFRVTITTVMSSSKKIDRVTIRKESV